MKAYIAIGRNSRNVLKREADVIRTVLTSHHIEPWIFVEEYSFNSDQEREMMMQAMSDIDGCDLFIAEISEKAIGVGVEVGYAKARGKAIVYIRRKDSEHSTTVAGVSDFQIIYNDSDHLKNDLENIVKLWITRASK